MRAPDANVLKGDERLKEIRILLNKTGAFLVMHILSVCFCRPYDGKWSKSMVGYGPEDNHFVVELTYNYGIGSYKLGNDFRVRLVKVSLNIKPISKAKHILSLMIHYLL